MSREVILGASEVVLELGLVGMGWSFFFQFSVFSFQFSVFSFQFSVFSFQFSVHGEVLDRFLTKFSIGAQI